MSLCVAYFPLVVLIILLPALVWSVLMIVAYFTCGTCKSKARLDGKTVILTGCTSGIGVTTAFELARRGARLIMACRNVERANAVRQQIVETTHNENVVVMQLDVSVLTSVRKFAEKVLKSENRLDVLIHNAGLLSGDETTVDGINIVWATNHFGPFLLTHLLIDLLKKTIKSRIIYVSSLMHYLGILSLEHPTKLQEKYPTGFYCATKYANVLIAKELSRRLKGTGVTANSLHPGVINTPICRQGPLWWRIINYISKPMQKDVEQGAQTTIHLAVSEEVENVSGKFFSDCKVLFPAWGTGNADFAKKYWKLCEEIVQLKHSDPHI